MENIIEQIAKENGVTAQEVEKGIQDAISLAMQNPQARSFWGAYTEAPSVEEFVKLLASQIE